MIIPFIYLAFVSAGNIQSIIPKSRNLNSHIFSHPLPSLSTIKASAAKQLHPTPNINQLKNDQPYSGFTYHHYKSLMDYYIAQDPVDAFFKIPKLLSLMPFQLSNQQIFKIQLEYLKSDLKNIHVITKKSRDDSSMDSFLKFILKLKTEESENNLFINTFLEKADPDYLGDGFELAIRNKDHQLFESMMKNEKILENADSFKLSEGFKQAVEIKNNEMVEAMLANVKFLEKASAGGLGYGFYLAIKEKNKQLVNDFLASAVYLEKADYIGLGHGFYLAVKKGKDKWVNAMLSNNQFLEKAHSTLLADGFQLAVKNSKNDLVKAMLTNEHFLEKADSYKLAYGFNIALKKRNWKLVKAMSKNAKFLETIPQIMREEIYRKTSFLRNY